jgi:hypothetical protein
MARMRAKHQGEIAATGWLIPFVWLCPRRLLRLGGESMIGSGNLEGVLAASGAPQPPQP